MQEKVSSLSTTLTLAIFLTMAPANAEEASNQLESIDWLRDDWPDLDLNENSIFTYMNPVVPLFLAGFSLSSRVSYSYQCQYFLTQHEQLNSQFEELHSSYFQKNSPEDGSSSESSPEPFLQPDLTVEGLVSPEITMGESLLLLEGTVLCAALKDSSFLTPAPFCMSVKFVTHLKPLSGQRALYESLKEGPVLSYLYKDLKPVWKPLHMRRSSLERISRPDQGEEEDGREKAIESELDSALEEELDVVERNDSQQTGRGNGGSARLERREEGGIDDWEEQEEYRVPCLVYSVTKVKGKWRFLFIAKKYFKDIDMSRYVTFSAEMLFNKEEPAGGEFKKEDLTKEGEFGIGQEVFVADFRSQKQ